MCVGRLYVFKLAGEAWPLDIVSNFCVRDDLVQTDEIR